MGLRQLALELRRKEGKKEDAKGDIKKVMKEGQT
jgi:hypothetical protein